MLSEIFPAIFPGFHQQQKKKKKSEPCKHIFAILAIGIWQKT